MLARHPIRPGTATAVLLEYIDAAGDLSTRRVMPVAMIADKPQRITLESYLQARCSIAKALRTFRLDRIQSLSDPRTGEVFDLATWLSDLQLGEGRPYAWSFGPEDKSEDDDSEPALSADWQVAEVAPVQVRTRSAWRTVLLAVMFGYMIGRLRLIHLGLRYFGAHHALWL